MKTLKNSSIFCLYLAILFFGIFLFTSQDTVAATSIDIRLAGNNRFETSFAIAEQLYQKHGKFDNMTVASGMNYPDALSGCYLTCVKDTPLLLVDKSVESMVLQRIKQYTKKGGTVYFIGGAGSISEQFEARVQAAGFRVKRLAQSNRFGTNLEILKEIGSGESELLVASGLNYPDSLSASAVKKPLLLVANTLNNDQKAFLKQAGVKRIYILGGAGSVSRAVENELRTYCPKIERIGGANRYETSYLIAKRFFPKASIVTLASGLNFPDGLSGGPVAMSADAPLILVSETNTSYAKDYVETKQITKDIIFGGTGSVNEETVRQVMVVKPEEEEKPDSEGEEKPDPEEEEKPDPDAYENRMIEKNPIWLENIDKGRTAEPDQILKFSDLDSKGISGEAGGIVVDLYRAKKVSDQKEVVIYRFTNTTNKALLLTFGYVMYNTERITIGGTSLTPMFLEAGQSGVGELSLTSSCDYFDLRPKVQDFTANPKNVYMTLTMDETIIMNYKEIRHTETKKNDAVSYTYSVPDSYYEYVIAYTDENRRVIACDSIWGLADGTTQKGTFAKPDQEYAGYEATISKNLKI